jgi:hypothetical protein
MTTTVSGQAPVLEGKDLSGNEKSELNKACYFSP